MKLLSSTLILATLVVLVTCEPPVSKRPMVFHNWPPKNGKQIAVGRNPGGKQRTLVVQIRSDQPVPLVLKGRPGHAHANGHAHGNVHGHVHAHGHQHHVNNFHTRPMGRPIKLSAPMYLKPGSMMAKPMQRKPLKFKLSNSKPMSKPSLTYEKPFQYELPSTTSSSFTNVGEIQKLPLEAHTNFISEHFAPIHTIPAPNLALHDNHIHHEDHFEQPQQQTYHPSKSHYQVTEDNTNDQTILDPFSGSQKLFAPDPDPSLPAAKVRPAIESFNQPSNGKPLPADVQSNYLPPAAQPLVQIIGAQQQLHANQAAPEIYPIQFAQQSQLPQYIATPNVGAPISVYNPTYLVTQSNNLYTQHQQQLFKPVANVIEAGYVDADLTQEVASNGQILQAAKDPHNNIHPVLDSAPQFAALIAAPALGESHHQAFEVAAPFRLTNTALTSTTPESGFVVSNFFGNSHHDSSQLLQSYAEEEAQRQQLVAEQASLELQQQKHYQQVQLQQEQQHLAQVQLQQEQQHLAQLQHEQDEQQLLLQQQQNHLLELQQHQQHLQQQQQQQQLHQQQPQQQQIQLHHPQQQLQPQQHADPAAFAFEEHQRLVQQQLGADTPLRIFVPDEEAFSDGSRIQKRSDNLKKGIVEDANARGLSANENSFEVSSSVEVSSEHQRDDEDSDQQQQPER